MLELSSAPSAFFFFKFRYVSASQTHRREVGGLALIFRHSYTSLFFLVAGAANIGKGIGGILFSRFSRSNSQPSVSIGLEGGASTEEEEEKRTESQSAYGLSTMTRPTSPTNEASRQSARPKQSRLSRVRVCHSKRLSAVSSSGAGAPHGLRAAGGPGREPLLVGGDVAHGLLVLTWHSPLPAQFHLQAQDAAVQPGGGDGRAGLRRRKSPPPHTQPSSRTVSLRVPLLAETQKNNLTHSDPCTWDRILPYCFPPPSCRSPCPSLRFDWDSLVIKWTRTCVFSLYLCS